MRDSGRDLLHRGDVPDNPRGERTTGFFERVEDHNSNRLCMQPLEGKAGRQISTIAGIGRWEFKKIQ
jgi:hypothetical protein